MNIQIFGTKKCADTRKAERYFKERRIPFQMVNLTEKGVSKGELANIAAAVGGYKQLIDYEGREYQRLNLKYMAHNIETEVLEHPLLLKTPIVRNGRQATIGYQPEVWKLWQ